MAADCCFRGFEWKGAPAGHEITVAGLNVYVAGTNKDRAILLAHDAFGWTYKNTRLLADHFAREGNLTVYVPDFFGGEVLPAEDLLAGRHPPNLQDFLARNSCEAREPEVFRIAKHLRTLYRKVGAVGYCWGGWAVFRLGAKGNSLVDCITAVHPSLLTENDIDEVQVPVQILAPEVDPIFPAELKLYCFQTLQKAGVTFDYVHFPGIGHGALSRGDENKPGEREAMAVAKNHAVGCFSRFLG